MSFVTVAGGLQSRAVMSAGGQRVFLVDGQAVYLEGGGDISEDVLQQALTQLTTRAPAAAEPQQDTVLGGFSDGRRLPYTVCCPAIGKMFRCTDGIVCRGYVLVLSVSLHRTFRLVSSPAVVRCWLTLRRAVWGMALSHGAPLPSNVLRLLGFELGSPDHGSDTQPLHHRGPPRWCCG